ncbi:hypothetical protein ACQKNX_08215 [Lysinibacillus sp. NPDC093712]|uniref:hypothetical protein n=1 Tax=Lysinibacillus sp. NPDC093712 TaxID=3390579 RepID=UPI003D072441
MAKLKLSDVKQRVKELHKKQKFYLDKEDDVFIEYYPKFSEKKINQTLEELFITITYCQENEIDNLNSDDKIMQYLQFLVIKHFTSLKEELDKKPFDIHFKTKNELEETGLYRIFLDHMFDPAEVYEVLDRMNDVVKLGTDIANELERNPQNENLNNLKVVDKLVN